jgi:hypothetical protein
MILPARAVDDQGAAIEREIQPFVEKAVISGNDQIGVRPCRESPVYCDDPVTFQPGQIGSFKRRAAPQDYRCFAVPVSTDPVRRRTITAISRFCVRPVRGGTGMISMNHKPSRSIQNL